MSLAVLRSFIEVFRRASISEAAHALSLTQPGVSQHIAGLETQIGRLMFERQSRGVQPTLAAVDLYEQIGDGLDWAERALAAAKARSHSLTGTVHLAGLAEFLSEAVVPRLGHLVEFGLDLRLRRRGKSDLYDMLLGSEVDLAVTASCPDDGKLAFAEIATERWIAAATPTMAERIGRNLSNIWQYPVLAYDLDAPLIREWAQANALSWPEIKPVATPPDLRTVRDMACAGLGWTVPPDYLCTAERGSGRFIDLFPKAVSPRNILFLVWMKTAPRHPRIAFAQQALMSTFSNENWPICRLGSRYISIFGN